MIDQIPAWQGWAVLAVLAILSYIVVRTFWTPAKETKQSFTIGNRDVPWFPLSGSIAATWLGAPALFVTATQAYNIGWQGMFWFTVPNILSLVLFATIVQRVRRKYPDGFTLSEAIGRRAGKATQHVYQGILVAGQVLQSATQLAAGAVLIHIMTGINHAVMVIAMGAIVLAYTIRTGIKATILTDTVQVILIVAVLGTLSLWYAIAAGDFVLAGLNGPNGDHGNMFSPEGVEVALTLGLVSGLGLLFGPFNDQSFWQRAWSGRQRDLNKAYGVGAFLFVVAPVSAGLFGLGASGAGVTIDDPQVANLVGMQAFLPSWTVLPFALAVMASILSTIDSQLSSIGSLAAHDFTKDPANAVRNGRWAMVALVVVAVAIAATGETVTTLFSIFAAVRMAPTGITALATLTDRTMSTVTPVVGLGIGVLVGVPLVAYGVINGAMWFTFAGTLTAILAPGIIGTIGSRKPVQEPVQRTGAHAAH